MPRKWSLELFKQLGNEVHEGKYDYSTVYLVSHDKHKIAYDIKCNKCNNVFSQRIDQHIDRCHGCLICADNDRNYSYEKFLIDAKEKHGDKYDYSLIDPNMKFMRNPKINIKCNNCETIFKQSVWGHTYHGNGCRVCTQGRYTYQKFIKRANEVHGDKYDYSLINKDIVFSSKILVSIICKKCNYKFDQIVDNHISGKGCKSCAGNIKYTYQKFIEKAVEVHKDRYDYSLVDPLADFKMTTHVNIKCNKCGMDFYQKIGNHIHSRGGCRYCKRSHGELAVADYLSAHNYKYTPEYRLLSLPRRRFDFMMIKNDDYKYLIEFDGGQHFKLSNLFHESVEDFENDKYIDVIKSVEAIKCGYTMIRIGYNISINEMVKFLDYALCGDKNLYVSDTNLYNEHLIKVAEILPDVEVNN